MSNASDTTVPHVGHQKQQTTLRPICFIGPGGDHFQKRIWPAAAPKLGSAFQLNGLERREPKPEPPFPTNVVASDEEALDRLKAFAPWMTYNSTSHEANQTNAVMSLEAGSRLHLTEKPIASSLEESHKLLQQLEFCEGSPQLRVVDSYSLFPEIREIRNRARQWLGDVRKVNISLMEDDGPIPPSQIDVHKCGMSMFMHHAVAIFSLFSDLEGIRVIESRHSKYERPEVPKVPDTYRRIQLKDGDGRRLTAEVGKRIEPGEGRKWIEVIGTNGNALFDRNCRTLDVWHSDDSPRAIDWRPSDEEPYDFLFAALARMGEDEKIPDDVDRFLLNPQQAHRILEVIDLTEQRTIYRKLKEYPQRALVKFRSRPSVAAAPSRRKFA